MNSYTHISADAPANIGRPLYVCIKVYKYVNKWMLALNFMSAIYIFLSGFPPCRRHPFFGLFPKMGRNANTHGSFARRCGNVSEALVYIWNNVIQCMLCSIFAKVWNCMCIGCVLFITRRSSKHDSVWRSVSNIFDRSWNSVNVFWNLFVGMLNYNEVPIFHWICQFYDPVGLEFRLIHEK